MTYLELINQEHPDIVSESTNKETGAIEYLFGCPRSYDYESTWKCPFRVDGNRMSCKECWNREIPEIKAEEPIKLNINLEEGKKMRNLRALIESKVEDAIASGKIDDYVENIVEDMNLDGDIDDLIETEIRENIDDYVGPILSEAVRDAVREALDNLFN